MTASRWTRLVISVKRIYMPNQKSPGITHRPTQTTLKNLTVLWTLGSPIQAQFGYRDGRPNPTTESKAICSDSAHCPQCIVWWHGMVKSKKHGASSGAIPWTSYFVQKQNTDLNTKGPSGPPKTLGTWRRPLIWRPEQSLVKPNASQPRSQEWMLPSHSLPKSSWFSTLSSALSDRFQLTKCHLWFTQNQRAD